MTIYALVIVRCGTSGHGQSDSYCALAGNGNLPMFKSFEAANEFREASDDYFIKNAFIKKFTLK